MAETLKPLGFRERSDSTVGEALKDYKYFQYQKMPLERHFLYVKSSLLTFCSKWCIIGGRVKNDRTLKNKEGEVIMGKIISALVILAVLLVVFGFIFDNNPRNPKNVARGNKNHQVASSINYGNGVYYFDSTGANFGNALSDFLERNESLEVVSIAGDDSGGHGSTNGYFVVTKTK